LETEDRRAWEQRQGPGDAHRVADHRSAFEHDRGRIIHSAAFRRLQTKTQVLGIGEGDFHRTRLTHSLEVSQISGGILGHVRSSAPDALASWLPERDLLEAICLAHDLGHPPFGHGGEVALNYMMRDHGGFEGNGQTLRILARLEAYIPGRGLDLARRTLLGVLKYPLPYSRVRRTSQPPLACAEHIKASDWKPPKCYLDTEKDLVEWLLEPFCPQDRELFIRSSPPEPNRHGKPTQKTLDTSMMELADDIAYGVHDLEDAIALGLIQEDRWRRAAEPSFDTAWASRAGLPGLDELRNRLFPNYGARKRAIGSLVHAFVVSTRLKEKPEYAHPLLRWGVEMEEPALRLLKALKDLIHEKVVKTPNVQILEYRGQQLVMKVFDALASDPERFLKPYFAKQFANAPDETAAMRSLCDYVAGMTDEYATRVYERFFIPREGMVFDRI